VGPVTAAREHECPPEVRDASRQIGNESVHSAEGDYQAVAPLASGVRRVPVVFRACGQYRLRALCQIRSLIRARRFQEVLDLCHEDTVCIAWSQDMPGA
jgi:hypothetical protein